MKKEKDVFVAHGSYVVSNNIVYLIQINRDGSEARICVNNRVTDWYEIEYSNDLLPTIDFEGYNVPLDSVLKLSVIEFMDIHTCCLCKVGYVGYGNNPAPVKKQGKCCDKCNYEQVIPARLKAIQ